MPKEVLFFIYIVRCFALKVKFLWNRFLTSQFWELMLTGEYRHNMYVREVYHLIKNNPSVCSCKMVNYKYSLRIALNKMTP